MFFLASKSPRREELLKQIGCEFRIVSVEVKEIEGDAMPPKLLAEENAKKKALAAAKIYGDTPALGADTIVALNGVVYGKPKDEADARNMIAALAGNTHEVITGIAFAVGEKIFSDCVTTKVRFAPMTADEIAAYAATGESLDKSGSYALQGRAAAFIEGIDGSYSNVVGLPLNAVCKLAKKAGVDLFAPF